MRLYNPIKNNKGIILATVVVMSSIILILCSTVTILTTYVNTLKKADRVFNENSVSVKNIGNKFLYSGDVEDENDDGIIDETTYVYKIKTEANRKALFVLNSNGNKFLLVVSCAYDGANWNLDGWYESPSEILTEHVDEPTCTIDGLAVYTIPNGLVYKNQILPALGHDYQEGVCTRCDAVEE